MGKKKTAAKSRPKAAAARAATSKTKTLEFAKSTPVATKSVSKKVDSAPRLFKTAMLLLWRHKKLFLGILVLYALLNLLFVQSLGAININDLKSSVKEATHATSELAASATLFVYLLGASGTTAAPGSGVAQFVLVLVASLALIWALRSVYGQQAVRVRDAFYQGMYPLVPFVLVLGVALLQLLPFIIGGSLYSSVVSAGAAVSGLEQIIWAVVFFLLFLLSLWLITATVFALYIASLPDMTPWRALRSARKLVRGRRFMVLRKLIFLPFVLFVGVAAVTIPAILFVPPLAVWVLFVLSVLCLAVAHSYLYTLYRELL